MYSEIKKTSLLEDTYAYIGRASNEENAEKFRKQIKNYIEDLKEIVDADFDKLNDSELYDLLSKFYSISLDENDYLKMFSRLNNKQYTFLYKIPTTMTFMGGKSEGHGKNFDWWNQLYQVYFLAAISSDIEFDYNKIYSKEEIKQMINDKNIVILKQKSEPIEDDPEFKQERFDLIPTLDIDIKEYGNNMSNFVIYYFHLFGELLRKEFPKRKVLKDIREFMTYLKDDIEEVFSNAKSNEYLYSGVSTICQDWFQISKVKEDFESIQEKLSKDKR